MPSYLEPFLIISHMATFLQLSSHLLPLLEFLPIFVFCICYLYIQWLLRAHWTLANVSAVRGQGCSVSSWISFAHGYIKKSCRYRWQRSEAVPRKCRIEWVNECVCVCARVHMHMQPPLHTSLAVFSAIHFLGFLSEVICWCFLNSGSLTSGGLWGPFWGPVREDFS